MISFPTGLPYDKAAALGREWGKRSASKRKTPESIPWDTIVKRGLHDRRGNVIKEGVTYHGDGRITHWHLRHAIHGRIDQFELMANGMVVKCGGYRKIPKDFRPDLD